MKLLGALFLAVALTGCSSLFPKKVEFFQDKVEKFPSPKHNEKEIQRQAAQRAAEKADEVLKSALAEGSGPAVVEPAKDVSRLTDSVSRSLGPPVSPSSDPSAVLAQRLDRAVALLNQRIDHFKAENDANAGKKIEGTGLFSVPYFVWLALVGTVLFIVWIVLKTVVNVAAAGNPAVALGLNAVQLGGRGAAALAREVVKGGQVFKQKLAAEAPEIRERVEALFTAAQKEAQSPAVQEAVKKLIS